MIQSIGIPDEGLRLWFGSESLTVVAKKYPRQCELSFDTDKTHHVIVLHNPVDAALLGAMLEADANVIRITVDGENRANCIEGGRYRVGLLDGYDDEIFSTLIDAFEHYSS